MNSGKIVVGGRVDGHRGSTRGPRGPKKQSHLDRIRQNEEIQYRERYF